jgi:hypothetical protein
MKSGILKSLLVIFLFTAFANISNAQRFYVKVHPVAPVVVARPVYHPANAVWVGGDYVWGGVSAGYQWHPGYYAVPPRPRAVWVPGVWVRERRGYYWRPGYWR